MDRLGRPRTDIHAFTMPGFATGEKTKAYATRLSEALGVTFEELDIRPAAEQMLKDLGHPYADGEKVYDVTFENVQAGLRYDYLFRLANHRGGIVVGTGDLSELALGWCTYGVGDQMSHYTVNAGVPKTLVQHLIRWVISNGEFERDANAVLAEILEQEITPELIPIEEGKKPQATEDMVGPYNLQDFTLFHVVRRGYRPRKIAFLAWHAWRDADAGEWPPGFPDEARVAYDLADGPHVARGLPQAVLRQPVQAQRPAQRPEGQRRRHDEPARRLADAERRQRRPRGSPRSTGRAGGAEPATAQPCADVGAGEHACATPPIDADSGDAVDRRAHARARSVALAGALISALMRRPLTTAASAPRRLRSRRPTRPAAPRERELAPTSPSPSTLRGLRDPALQRARHLRRGRRRPGRRLELQVRDRRRTGRSPSPCLDQAHRGHERRRQGAWEGRPRLPHHVAWRYNGEARATRSPSRRP